MKKMIPNILENDYLKGNCVLFVGAGISARIKRNNGTNVPNWKELVNLLIDFIYNIYFMSFSQLTNSRPQLSKCTK